MGAWAVTIHHEGKVVFVSKPMGEAQARTLAATMKASVVNEPTAAVLRAALKRGPRKESA